MEKEEKVKNKKYITLIIVFFVVAIGIFSTPKLVEVYKYYNYKYYKDKQQTLEASNKNLYRKEKAAFL